MDTSATRVCKKCLKEKPLTEEFFGIHNRKGKKVFRKQCKVCQSLYKKDYYAKNKERLLQYHKDWVDNLIQQGVPFHAIAYQKHRDHKLAYRAEYAEQHPEKVTAAWKKYKSTHKDQINEAQNKRRDKDIEGARERERDWGRRNPDKVQSKNLSRRAKVKKAEIVDKPTIDQIGERDHWRCHICKGNVHREDATLDHHFPLSLPDAKHGAQYVSLAHRRCNSARGAGRLPAQLRLFT